MNFFRDRQVIDQVKIRPHTNIVAMSGYDKIVGAYPPNGIIPCAKFSTYFGPFSYISEKKEDCYYIFRAMYCKYFCYL